MWDNHRPPFNAFRGRPEEHFPLRWPHEFEARMRGPPPLPFGGGAAPAGPSYAAQGSLPYSYRDTSRGQEGAWEEDKMSAEHSMNLSRAGRPPANFKDMADRRYADWVLTPDMDYRERDREQRAWTAPDVDYRNEERAAVAYRQRLSSASVYRDPENFEYKRKLILEMEQRDVEALELEHQQRLGAALDYREREAAEMQYNLILGAIVKQREREEILLREREYAEHLMRGRENAELLRDREPSAVTPREREAAAMFFREMGIPEQYRESGDLDLRLKEASKALESLKRERGSEFQERLPREYSESEAVSYMEKETVDYMKMAYQKDDSLKASNREEAVGFTTRGQESTEMPYRQGKTSQADYKQGESPTLKSNVQKQTDSDYRKKARVDTDYRGKESSDSDYRGQEKASIEYRNIETADSDYRGKESTDSDYWKRESVDTDYRRSADDNKADKMETATNFSSSALGKDTKGLTSVKTAKETNPNLRKMKTDKMSLSPLPNVKKESPSTLATKGQLQSKSATSQDRDFRGVANPEAAGKAPAADGTGKKLPPADQDLRGNRTVGDQDMRTGGYVQKKDEDFRGGEANPHADFFSQNALLLDVLRLAAKELRGKTTSRSDAGEEPVPQASSKPNAVTAGVSHAHQSSSPAKSSAPETSSAAGIEFMGRVDADYRSMDFNDVDLRLGYRQGRLSGEKRPREEPQPGSKDKDYRKVAVPEGATKILWLDGLPTGASREEILCALGVHKLSEHEVNLIGYIPGYSLGSVCVEFSLVEEAVGCMEAHKGVLHFRGKKVTLKYIPNSDRWCCLQCKAVNVLSKERCWQCSALRAGTDHLSLKKTNKDLTPLLSLVLPPRAKKRKGKRSPSGHSPDLWKDKSPPKESSPQAKKNKGAKLVDPESATIIIRGIGVNTSPDTVVKALQPYVQLSPNNVRIMKNRKSNQRGFGFIDLKNHKEAIRLTVLVRELKPPLTIDGKVITVDLAVGQRKFEQGRAQKGNKGPGGKNRKQKGTRRPITYPGFKANANEGPSYVFDPATGRYVDPLTDSYFDGKNEHKRDDYSNRDSEADGKGQKGQTRRGFTEEETEDTAFKVPLPPPVKKDESPPEPKVNPLLGLIGMYEDDSEEEEEEEPEEEPLPPVKKKPPPPPPVPAPKPPPKPTPAVPTTSGSSEEDKLTDWKKMACLLCRRQFPNKDALIRHQKLSDLHKQNVAIHEKIRKSQRELAYLQQKEREENQSIQRRLLQAKKELEMLEREEEGAQQQEAGEALDTDAHTPEKKKSKGPDTRSEHAMERNEKRRAKGSAGQKTSGESYRDNMKRLILERYKQLE